MRTYPDPRRLLWRWLLACAGAGLAAGALAADVGRGWVVSVIDGDTLDVQPLDGAPRQRLRLEGIDAPEICQEGGVAAKWVLARRVLMRVVDYRIRREDDFGRGVARVWLDGDDVSAGLVLDGHAWSYRYQRGQGPYIQQEMQARAAGRGIFAQPSPEEPRDFRRRHGSCH